MAGASLRRHRVGSSRAAVDMIAVEGLAEALRRGHRRSPASRSRFTRARSSGCSGRTAPASRPPFASSAHSRRPMQAARRSPVTTCSASPRTSDARSATSRRSRGSTPTATGRENLTLQGRVQGLGGGRLRRRVDELLEQVGIADAADRVVKGYSGGMKRRLDIALGLVHSPQVLFLDEPTTGLDPEARAAMWEELGALATRETLTILLTTHYLEEADQLADRLAIVSRGRIVVEGTPEDLKRTLRGEAVQRRARGRNEQRPGGGRARALGRSRGAARRPPPPHARRQRRPRHPGHPLGPRRCRDRRRGGHRRTGPRSTTSTSTTRAASSPPTRRPHDGAPAYLVHDPASGTEPHARADLDRAPADPADHLARPLRSAVQAASSHTGRLRDGLVRRPSSRRRSS